MSLKILCFSIIVLAFASTTIHAQDSSRIKFLIGPIGGYNLVTYHSDEFGILAVAPTWFTAQNGSGKDLSFGISGEIPLSSDMHDFFVVEALYDSKSGNFNTMMGQKPDTPSVNITSTNLATSLKYILINFGFKYDFKSYTNPSGLGVQLCLSVGIKNWSTFTKSSTATSSDGTQSTEVDISSIEDATGLRIALRPELTYDIPLSGLWILTPSLGYDAPLTKVDQDFNWSASSAYGAIALRYAFG